MADKYLNLDEVLDMLKIEEDSLETLISNGEIKAYRTQGKVKFKEDDINDLLERIDSINMDSVIDDDELPSLSDSSEVLPAVELEELEESDFTIELPDDIAAGDPSLSGGSLALEDDDAFALDTNDDFDLDSEDIEVGSDTNPSDITINADDLDLDLDDSNDSFATSDITIHDDEDRYATSDLTVQEEAVNTSDLTVQEDAINTSELTVQDDAVNTSEMTVDDGFGTEASLTVQDGEFADDGDIEEEEYEDSSSKSKRRLASSGSGRRSGRSSSYEFTQVSMLWSVLLVVTIVANLFAMQYVLPYFWYNDNKLDENTKVVIPKLLEGSKDWALKTFGDENRFPSISTISTYEMEGGDAAVEGGGEAEPN